MVNSGDIDKEGGGGGNKKECLTWEGGIDYKKPATS